MDRTLKLFIASLAGLIVLIVILDGLRVKPVNWEESFSLDKKSHSDYIFSTGSL